MTSNPWLIRMPIVPRQKRLYCFSYAGGNAATFLPWQTEIDPSFEICAIELPGHGTRMREPCRVEFSALIADLAQIISLEKTSDFAFFGHSLGALIAFEVARYCQANHLPLPAHLFVSGCATPSHRGRAAQKLHELTDQQLIEVLKEYKGSPPAVLAHQELMALMLPIIRADFALVADYQYRPGTRLTMPITVLSGRSDDFVTQNLDGWKQETLGPSTIAWFEGEHFFIHPQRSAVIACLNTGLNQLFDPAHSRVSL